MIQKFYNNKCEIKTPKITLLWVILYNYLKYKLFI